MDGSRARLVRALTFLCRARKGLQEAGREVCRGQAEPWQCSPFCPGAQRSSVALAGGHPTPSPTSDGCSEPLQPCQAGKMRGVAMAMPGLEGPSCLRKGSRGCPSRLTVGTADFRQHSGDQPRPPPPCPSASVPCHSATCSPPAPPPCSGSWYVGGWVGGPGKTVAVFSHSSLHVFKRRYSSEITATLVLVVGWTQMG